MTTAQQATLATLTNREPRYVRRLITVREVDGFVEFRCLGSGYVVAPNGHASAVGPSA